MPAPAQDSFVLFLREEKHLRDKGIPFSLQILNQMTNYKGPTFQFSELTVSFYSVC